MTAEIDAHTTDVEAHYHEIIAGTGTRLNGTDGLWSQFLEAVAAFFQHGRGQVTGVIERVNELTLARLLHACCGWASG